MNIEFCSVNFADKNIFPYVSITGSEEWGADFSKLYDRTSEHVLRTVDAADKIVTLEVDLGAPRVISVVKLLKCNLMVGKIEAKIFVEEEYSTVHVIANNQRSSYHHILNSAYLQDNEGNNLSTGLDYLINSKDCVFRYIRITFEDAQISEQEKFIGELYIGTLANVFNKGQVIEYTEAWEDPKSITIRDYRGRYSSSRRGSVYSVSVSVRRPSMTELKFIKYACKNGSIYTLFPEVVHGKEMDYSLSIDDIYFVSFHPRFNYRPFGRNADGVVSFKVEETYYNGTHLHA